MVSNATFNNIFSYIVAVCFIGEGSRSAQRKPPTCRKSLTNYQLSFELTALVIIGTDFTGNCKSNYYIPSRPRRPPEFNDKAFYLIIKYMKTSLVDARKYNNIVQFISSSREYVPVLWYSQHICVVPYFQKEYCISTVSYNLKEKYKS